MGQILGLIIVLNLLCLPGNPKEKRFGWVKGVTVSCVPPPRQPLLPDAHP